MDLQNKRPNLFDYATSELSHSALWAWIFARSVVDVNDTDGCRGMVRSLCAKCTIPDLGPPIAVRREVKLPSGRIDIDIEYSTRTRIIIENKVKAVLTNAQLKRYYEETKLNPCHYILLSVAFDVDVHHDIPDGWKYVGLEDLIQIVPPHSSKNCILKEYADWISLVNDDRTRIFANAKSDDWSQCSAALKSPEGQWSLLHAITLNLSGRQHRGRSIGGEPWTEFRFAEETDIHDTLFYRLDAPGGKPQLRVRQYRRSLVHDSHLLEKQTRLELLRRLWSESQKEIGLISSEYGKSDASKKECTIARFDLKTTPASQLCQLIPPLHFLFVKKLKEAGWPISH